MSAFEKTSASSFLGFALGLGSSITAIIDAIKSLFQQAEATRSPLVLDLDGDGVETLGLSSGIHFDHDGNGFAEQTGWVGKDDGLLVWDRNCNGTIDNGRELFGSNTMLASGGKAANGFAALVELDSNADGKFDASDAAFASVKRWKDTNQNGISEASELFTFAQLGVASINLNATASNVVLGGGNTQTFAGSFTRTDGEAGASDTSDLAIRGTVRDFRLAMILV